METAASLDFAAMHEDLTSASQAAITLVNALNHITGSVKGSYAGSTVGEQWARTWGELLTIKDAGKMLGVCPNTIRKLIANGMIKTSPDGRVLTRSAADWANSGRPKKPQRWRV